MGAGAPCTARSTARATSSRRCSASSATWPPPSGSSPRRWTSPGAPEQATSDGHDAYPRAIRETLGDGVTHRCRRDKNKRIAQDHRGVQQRYYPLRGFGSFVSAARCCTGFAEQRRYFRAQARSGEFVSLAERRRRFQDRWAAILAELATA